jgi:hypothetical protein
MYKHKLPGVVRFFLALLSIVLCFVLFATSLVTIVIADLHVVTSEGGLQTIITQILMPSKAPVARPGLAAGRPVIHYDETSLGGPTDMVVDALMDMLQQEFGSDLPITRDQVNAILAETTLPDFISEKAAGLVSGILNGEVPTLNITIDEVEDLILENRDVVKKYFDVEITDEMVDQITTSLEEEKILETVEQQLQESLGFTGTPGGDSTDQQPDDENVQTPTMAPAPGADSNQSGTTNTPGWSGTTNTPGFSGSTNTTGNNFFGGAVIGAVESFVGITPQQKQLVSGIIVGKEVGMTDLPVAIGLLNAISSLNSLLVCIGTCLLVFLLMLLTHWGRPFAAVRTAGIPVMLSGALMLLVGVAASTLLPQIGGQEGAMIAGIVNPVLTLFNYVSGGVAALGLVLIIVGATLNGVFTRRAEAKATATATAGPVSVPAGAPVDTFSEVLMAEEEAQPEAEAEEKAE